MNIENGTFRTFGEFRLDPKRNVLWFGSSPVNLPLKEIELLSVLTERAGEVLTKRELMDSVWADSFVEESNLSRHIYRIRKVFSDLGVEDEFIQTVPRRGYRFAEQVTETNGSDLMIVRHSLTRTLIEEIHSSDEPQTSSESATSASTLSKWFIGSRFRLLAVSLGLLVLVASGVVFLRYGGVRAGRAPIHSIAVLPFRNLEGADSNASRGLGIADLLITRLSSVKDISVRPTSTILEFDGKSYDLSAVGDKLRVDAILEGSIVQMDDHFRVTAQLVRLEDKFVFWSAQFDKANANESELQNEIALQVVEALSIDLAAAPKKALSKIYSESPDAMRSYQQGRSQWSKRSNEGIAEAQRLFRNAVAKDPNFALAYVGIADSLIFSNTIDEAATAVEKALELDPELGEAYATRGFIKMMHGWKWDEAEADLKRSIELSPGYINGHQWYATLLMIRRRPLEARSRLETALEINPISYNLLSDLCQADYFSKEFSSAIEHCDKALEIFPEFQYAHGHLSQIYFQLARNEDAVREHSIVIAQLSSQPNQTENSKKLHQDYVSTLMEPFYKGGIDGYWRDRISTTPVHGSIDGNNFVGLSQAYLALNDRESTLKNLSIAVDRHAFLAPFVNADPEFDALRSDPRFQNIVSRMGL